MTENNNPLRLQALLECKQNWAHLFCIQQISWNHPLIKQNDKNEPEIRGHEQDLVRALTLIIKMPKGSVVLLGPGGNKMFAEWSGNIQPAQASDGLKWQHACRDSDRVVLCMNSKTYRAEQSQIYFLIISYWVSDASVVGVDPSAC